MLDIYFETYGCTANYNSTEIMKGLLVSSGLNITSDIKRADIVIINSCIVKEPTEEKIRRRISDILKQEKKVIVSGCMPRLKKDKLQKPNLYLIDTSQIKNLPNLIKDIYENNYQQEKYLKQRREIKLCLPKIPKEKYIGITQISEGCFGNCSYCATRFAKGQLYSYPKEKIIESVKKDLESGCKEIWLTSQDNASYGTDFEEKKPLLHELINEITSLNHKFYLRIGMMNPDNILKFLPALIESYKNKKVFKFLHIPIQSGSNKILKKMNRNYKIEEVYYIIDKFREAFPEIHISTDVITGFPSETQEDHKKTLEAIKKIKPETINISKFWPRSGTKASEFEEQINSEIKKQRAIELAKLHKDICIENQKRFIDKEFRVLVDQKGFNNTFLARDENYKLFAVITDKKILGKLLNIKVKKTTPHYLISEPLQ